MKYRFIMLCAVALVALGLSCGGTEVPEGDSTGRITFKLPDHDDWPADITSVALKMQADACTSSGGVSEFALCICRSSQPGCDIAGDGSALLSTFQSPKLCPGNWTVGQQGNYAFPLGGCFSGNIGAPAGWTATVLPDPVVITPGVTASAVVTYHSPTGYMSIDIGFDP